MPEVRGQHFPYTKKGKAQAKQAREKGKKSQRPSEKEGGPSKMPMPKFGKREGPKTMPFKQGTKPRMRLL